MNEETVRELVQNIRALIDNYDKQKETYRELFSLCYRHIVDTRPAKWLTKEEREERRQLLAVLSEITTKEKSDESEKQP